MLLYLNSEVICNREPNFMKTGRILVDKFHIKNHVDCSRGYDARSYPDMDSVNTQTCEQLNGEIKKLSAMVCFAKPKTAWRIITVYMCLKNYLRRHS